MKHKKLRALCEGAIMVALATALSYLVCMYIKEYSGELPQGGSVCIGMLPIFLYSARWGVGPAFLTSFAYGLLQLLLDGAYAWGPTSMLLDYLLAFGVLGVAGFFHGKKGGVYIGTVLGCVCRFIIHFISGITIYRIYEPKNIPGFGTFDNANLYSLVYNGSYMLPNMLLALAIAAVLYIPLKKYFAGQDIRK